MPVVDAKGVERREKRRSRAQGEAGKMKRTGIEAGKGARGNGSAQGQREKGKLQEGERWIECRVVHEQPLLWVKRSNLTHGTVMLYDGER